MNLVRLCTRQMAFNTQLGEYNTNGKRTKIQAAGRNYAKCKNCGPSRRAISSRPPYRSRIRKPTAPLTVVPGAARGLSTSPGEPCVLSDGERVRAACGCSSDRLSLRLSSACHLHTLRACTSLGPSRSHAWVTDPGKPHSRRRAARPCRAVRTAAINNELPFDRLVGCTVGEVAPPIRPPGARSTRSPRGTRSAQLPCTACRNRMWADNATQVSYRNKPSSTATTTTSQTFRPSSLQARGKITQGTRGGGTVTVPP